MNFFTNNPFTKVLSFWLVGLLLGSYLPSSFWILLAGWFIGGALAISRLQTKRYPFDFHLSIFLAFSFALAAFSSIHQKEPPHDDQPHHYIAKVISYPSEKPNSYQCQLQINNSDSLTFNRQKIIAYFSKDSMSANLQPGDQLWVKSKLQRIKNSEEPYSFNYQKFMANREIYFSCFIPSKNYFKIQGDRSWSPTTNAEKVRATLISQLKKYIDRDDALQVISALTLGYRQELSPETKYYFASTGAMHVLAVSGLHVGMIFLFLSYVLAFLKKTKTGRIFYLILIASLLWAYALLTGFSPSVQRATVMFCFILIGNSLRRPTSIYNSIAASAFLLLLFNPNLIHEVGFQLSYAAVTSIVFLYPKLTNWWHPKNWGLQKIWQLLCVSLAAQIGTLPFSIYYFHQFPVYFWLSNFVVIPAAYLILGFTFLFFLTTPIHIIASLLAKLLSGITGATIFLLQQINQLPCSLIENISINSVQLILLIVFSISVALFIKQKQSIFILSASTLLLFFLIAGLTEKIHYFNQQKMIVYHREDKVLLINGRKSYLLQYLNLEQKNMPERSVIQKLKLNQPITISLDSCLKFETEDMILEGNTFQFLNQTFQLEERKENQQQRREKDRRKLFFRIRNLSDKQKNKVDSILNQGVILNFCDLNNQEGHSN